MQNDEGMELEKPKMASEESSESSENFTEDEEVLFGPIVEAKFKDLNVLKRKDTAVSEDLKILNKKKIFKPKGKIILKQSEHIQLKDKIISDQTELIKLHEKELARYRIMTSSYRLGEMGRDLTIKRLEVELKYGKK